MVKRFMMKRKGIVPAIKLAQILKQEMVGRVDDFLFNSLIVMVEDFPSKIKIEEHEVLDPWSVAVTEATVMVLDRILKEKWMKMPIGVLVQLDGRYGEFSLFRDSKFCAVEFESVLVDCKYLADVGLFNPDHKGYRDYVETCWYGPVMNALTLYDKLAVCRDQLISTKQSYVKMESYRRHSTLIHEWENA